ncbi:MAG: hypothetical protein AABZ41_07760, partial [Bacteroidota bacterium]
MMRPGRILVVLCVLANSAFAQQRRALSAQSDHPLSSAVGAPRLLRNAVDTLRVLALMVDFVTAQDARTSGDGKFQLQTNVTGLIDPPPHDSTYFANKFRFVENYFKKVSNGQLTVRGDVLGRVITVGKPLADYAPTKNGNSNRGLANLAIESWRAADTLIVGIPFSQYECFVVFHAGVGHDIDVVGFLGFDTTPDDLPSLYLSLKSFQDALQDPTFAGIQTRSGDTIKNTVVLPETETRVFGSGSSSQTLELSINGLAAASIGSHLGLPDLFDTKTGRQGIGQFGLMDGASIFAFSGLFPPEPSAWEKVYLGWVSPITVGASSVDLLLPAVGLTTTEPDTIYKVPISASEYFLIENRNRDPQKNGQTLTIFENGSTRTQTFSKDTSGFTFDDQSGITGSVVNVEDFDWALIGSFVVDEFFHGGGILIWHIDERVINAGLASNSVNADPNRRGVDLEEADGAQDIGQVYDVLEPGAPSVSGSPLDCWYEGNPSDVYQNTFDRNSFPNSNSNNGVPSLLEIKNFSKRSARMTLSVNVGNNVARPITKLSKSVGASSSDNSPQLVDNAIFVSKGDSIYAFQVNGKSSVPDSTGLFSQVGGRFPVAANVAQALGPRYILGVKDSSVYVFSPVDATLDSVYESIPVTVVNLGKRITTPVSIHFTTSYQALVGDAGGAVTSVNLPPAGVPPSVAVSSAPIQSLISGSGTWYATSSERIYKQSGERYNFTSPSSGFSAGSAQFIAVVDTVGRSILFFDPNLNLLKIVSIASYKGPATQPVIADVNRDGNQELLMTAGNMLLAFNKSGFFLDGFPSRLREGTNRTSSLVLRDMNGDDDIDIVLVTDRGVVQVVNSKGKVLEDLSVDVGETVSTSPLLFSNSGSIGFNV